MVEAKQWVSLSYEEDQDKVIVRVHALHPYGTRSVSVVREVDMTPELQQACDSLLLQHKQALAEWAEEAAITHRTIARNRGEDYNAPLEYIEGAGVTGTLEVTTP